MIAAPSPAGRVLVTVPEDIGAPDGMTVDAAGDLWVAIYGGGRVNRYAPDGSLRQVYPIPAPEVTCCALGGPGLHRLFVTTATEGWSDAQRRADPAAGRVYRVDTDATGRPVAPFIPDPAGGKTSPGEREPPTLRPTGAEARTSQHRTGRPSTAGGLWVATYGGGCVRYYTSDGQRRQVLAVPAAEATCGGFAGPNLCRLYLTR